MIPCDDLPKQGGASLVQASDAAWWPVLPEVYSCTRDSEKKSNKLNSVFFV